MTKICSVCSKGRHEVEVCPDVLSNRDMIRNLFIDSVDEKELRKNIETTVSCWDMRMIHAVCWKVSMDKDVPVSVIRGFCLTMSKMTEDNYVDVYMTLYRVIFEYLPVRRVLLVKESVDRDEEETCAVCMESKERVWLGCGHSFCADCVCELLKRKCVHCPMCRALLTRVHCAPAASRLTWCNLRELCRT